MCYFCELILIILSHCLCFLQILKDRVLLAAGQPARTLGRRFVQRSLKLGRQSNMWSQEDIYFLSLSYFFNILISIVIPCTFPSTPTPFSKFPELLIFQDPTHMLISPSCEPHSSLSASLWCPLISHIQLKADTVISSIMLRSVKGTQ